MHLLNLIGTTLYRELWLFYKIERSQTEFKVKLWKKERKERKKDFPKDGRLFEISSLRLPVSRIGFFADILKRFTLTDPKSTSAKVWIRLLWNLWRDWALRVTAQIKLPLHLRRNQFFKSSRKDLRNISHFYSIKSFASRGNSLENVKIRITRKSCEQLEKSTIFLVHEIKKLFSFEEIIIASLKIFSFGFVQEKNFYKLRKNYLSRISTNITVKKLFESNIQEHQKHLKARIKLSRNL